VEKKIKKMSFKSKIIYLIIVLILILSSLILIKELVSKNRQDKVISFIMDTTESGKLILSETTGQWNGIYRVPGKFLFIEQNWEAKYQVLYNIYCFVDFENDGAPYISISKDGIVKVKIPKLRYSNPTIITDSFYILYENRTILVNNEKARMELFNNLDSELSIVIMNLIDIEKSENISINSLEKIVKEACIRNNIKFKKIIVEII